MRQVIIDFRQEVPRKETSDWGKDGEHNKTTIKCILPHTFNQCEYINAEFQTADNRKVVFENLEVNEDELLIALTQQLTVEGRIKFQLVGYMLDKETNELKIISKTDMVTGHIDRSVKGFQEEFNPEPSFLESLWSKVKKLWDMRHSHHNQEILDQITEDGLGGGGNLPVAHINDEGELIFELAEGITDADINQYGELELTLETEDGEEAINLGKVKGRTPEFRLTEKLLELKYDDETVWNTLVDFSTIASSFDLRLNEETLFLEAKRDVNAEWEQVADLSKLAKAHEHPNKDVLDKITSGVFKNISDAVSKRHTHENINSLNQITDEHIENIDKIPEIEEDVAELINNPTKQLVEGMFYTDETKKGLSANKNAVPTADNVWIEGNASNYHSFDELMSSATLNVVTSTVNKSTKTTVTIKIVCNDSDSASFVKNTLSGGGYHIGVVFEDTPDNTFYIKISSATISDTTVSVEFMFIDGQETFPITGNITRAIQSLYTYPKNGIGSHIEGLETIAAGDYSHVQGKYNEIDTEGKYAHIVGNGNDEVRSNAHTLDWEGNAWYAGSVEADSVMTGSVEADSVMTEELISPTRIRTWSVNATLPYSEPYNNNQWEPLLVAGNWYAITINNNECIFQCESDDFVNQKVGEYNFIIYPNSPDYYPPQMYISVSGAEGEKAEILIERLVFHKEDIVPYIKESKEFFESPSLETLEIGVWDNEGASRETMLSGTISGILNWYNLFELKVGAFYAVTIDGAESIVRCSSPDGLSAEVGDISFFITRAWFDGEHEMFVFDAGSIDSTIVRTITIEKINLPRVDLMQYINDADAELLDKIESSALTEEQGQDLSLNTEARHTHENKDVLDTITTDKLVTTEMTETISETSSKVGTLERKVNLMDESVTEVCDIVNGIGGLVETQHVHNNFELLENFTEDENGELLYKGETIGATEETTYVTPQMFGAVADGVTDDTEAVQAALDNGGVVYFPAGVYKVTKQLTTTKPCIIKMFKQYPSRFWRSGKSAGRYDYPIQIFEGESDYETEKGWDFGARLECYPSEGEQYGLLIGDGCEVDGLFMRAMDGFSGTLLAYDNSHAYGTDNLGDPITYTSYPSAARFRHIRLDCDRHNHETTIPESMFDFYPHGKYFYILDDIVIGHQDEFATYGFRSIVDEEATWANSVRLKNLCIDGLFDYPLYIVEENTKHSLTNWIFDGMTIQTYGYTYDDFQKSLEGHKAVMTLKRLNYCHFTGCYIWDLYAAKYTKLFDCENLNNISCVGCSEEFYYGTKKLVGDAGEEGIETVLKGRLQEVADDANVKTLTVSTTTLEDGSNRIELTDNHGNTVGTDIPAVSLSDEQISTGVGDWMTENAAPVKIIGRNKLNIYSEDLLLSTTLNHSGAPHQNTSNQKYITTPYIPAKYGDVFRASHDGVMYNWSEIMLFDSNYTYLDYISYHDEIVGSAWTVALNHPDTAFIRVNMHLSFAMTEEELEAGYVTFEAVERGKLCITLNNADVSYEPYKEELIGGLSQYFLLQSPNGTQYSVGVTDDGVVVGKDKDGNITGSTIPVKTSQLENDSGFITEEDIPEISDVPTKVSQLENDKGYLTADELPESDIEVDQTYDSESENAQSGKAVSEAIDNIFVTTERNEEPIYSEELVNADGWTLNGWTGDLENGFTNTAGNTTSLIFTMPENTGTNTYLISFKCSETMASESLAVICGGSSPFNLHGQRSNPYMLGIKSVQNGNLEFVPVSTFTSTITEISVKRVLSPSIPRYQIFDSEGNASFDFKTSKRADDNIFIGRESGYYNISGYSNVAIGTRSLFSNTSGYDNIAIGYLSLNANTVGVGNVAIGLSALGSNTIGRNNTAIGARALGQNTTGKNNMAFGVQALTYNKDGSENTAIGNYALYLNTSGNDNSAIGARALGENTTGNNNVAYGKWALAKNQTGGSNVAIGNQSCYYIKTQSDNTGIGHAALYRCNDGTGNTAVGTAAGRGIGETFGRGVFIGKWAGLNLAGGADYNTFIGFKAGDTVTTGKNNILLGQNVQPPTPETSNWINAGNLYEGSVDTSDKYAKINGGLQLSDIPTADPEIEGRVWNDNGMLKVSTELDPSVPSIETRITALEDALTGADITADEILETIGGEE